MENAVYWQGRQVGIECAGRISWFPSAPQEAILAYDTKPAENVNVVDAVVACNLAVTARCDRWDFGG